MNCPNNNSFYFSEMFDDPRCLRCFAVWKRRLKLIGVIRGSTDYRKIMIS